jgi:hypothetical protein
LSSNAALESKLWNTSAESKNATKLIAVQAANTLAAAIF